MSDNTASQQAQASYYGYDPTLWVCDTFVILFGVTTAAHVFQAFYFKPRLYWLIPTIGFCGLGEVAGWSARIWSSQNPAKYEAFTMQLVATIIAPTFLTAAMYTILGSIVKQLGLQYSRLSRRAYIIVFITADILALVVQSVGGSIAAGANGDTDKANQGANVMVGGIFLQLAGITLYALLAAEVLVRFYFQKPVSAPAPSQDPLDNEENDIPEKALEHKISEKLKRGVLPPRLFMMAVGLVLSTVLVYIRTIYRSIELLDGWNGKIITTETYFNVFDGLPIVLAMTVLNVLHPSVLLRGPAST